MNLVVQNTHKQLSRLGKTEAWLCQQLDVEDFLLLPLAKLDLLAQVLNCSVLDLVNTAAQPATPIYPENISTLILDVDGVMTDGGMYYTESGDQFKRFDTKDGMAIRSLISQNYRVGLISSGFKSEIITKRAEVLGIQLVYVGRESKLEILTSWAKTHQFALENVAYIGDDVNDLEVMAAVGFAACPADATHKVKSKAHVILTQKGGQGCIREFIENVLNVDVTYS